MIDHFCFNLASTIGSQIKEDDEDDFVNWTLCGAAFCAVVIAILLAIIAVLVLKLRQRAMNKGESLSH